MALTLKPILPQIMACLPKIAVSRTLSIQYPPHQHRRRQILDRRAHRLEQRDLRRRRAAFRLAAAEVGEVAADVGLLDHAALDRLDDVAGLLGRARTGVDIDARAFDRLVVRLAHLRREAADEIDMGALL